MNKRPGQVRVTTEVGYCSFCGRPRNLRREEHQLGTLVRTIVTCESCHRTLSSAMGVAPAEPVPAEKPAVEAAPAAEAPAEPAPKPAPARVKRTTRPTAAARPKTAARRKTRP